MLYLLSRVQRFVHRHLFGVGYLITRSKGVATLLFYAVLLPGVIMHEISRFMIAGMFRIRPTHFTFVPDEQQDGTFELGFIHYGFVINPVFRAIVDLVPLVIGILGIIMIGGWALGWSDFVDSLRTLDVYRIGDAFGALVSKPDFFLWSYVLFGLANTMLPSRKEARGLWLPFALLGVIIGLFAVLGMDLAIIRLMTGPIGQIVYGLTAVFTVVLLIDLIAMGIIWVIERLLNSVTRQEVQYGPLVPAKGTKALPKPQPKSVYELALPLPPPPGKPGFRSRVIRPPSTALPIPVAEVHAVHTSSEDEPIIEKPEKTEVPALGGAQPTGAPALKPGPAVGTNLPVPAGPRPSTQPPAQPARPAPSFGAAKPSGDKPAEPAGPRPSTQPPAQPARPAPSFGAAKPPGDKPAEPASPRPSTQPPAQPAQPAPSFGAAKPPGDKPAEPARPSPFAPKPAASAGSSGNLPALRPAQPPAGAKPSTPAQPKPAFAPLGKPSPKPTAGRPVSDDDDVIEGEVVDDDVSYEDDPDYAPEDDE